MTRLGRVNKDDLPSTRKISILLMDDGSYGPRQKIRSSELRPNQDRHADGCLKRRDAFAGSNAGRSQRAWTRETCNRAKFGNRPLVAQIVARRSKLRPLPALQEMNVWIKAAFENITSLPEVIKRVKERVWKIAASIPVR